MVIPVEMPVAVRAWAPRDGAKYRDPGQYTDLGASRWTLVFDTETTVDPGQSLRVGAYQLRGGSRLAEAGLFYEPTALTPQELDTLRTYTALRSMRLLTRAEFVHAVFLRTAWDRRA